MAPVNLHHDTREQLWTLMDKATKSLSHSGSTQDALSLKQAKTMAEDPANDTNTITNRPTSHVFIR